MVKAIEGEILHRGEPVTTSEEIRVVALLAKGIRQKEIQQMMKAEFNRPLQLKTIQKIKKRNKANLEMIRSKHAETLISKASEIRDKTNEQILAQLEDSRTNNDIIAHYNKQYADGEITLGQLMDIKKKIKQPNFSELASLSKTMNDQAKELESDNKETEDPANLISALNDGDELQLSQIILKKSK